jgi:adenine-specific DNA-methyltransferase
LGESDDSNSTLERYSSTHPQNLLWDLIRLLETDTRLVADGTLLKNKVIEMALSLDPSLISLLRKHDRIKAHFFAVAGDCVVFDKTKFQQFVSNKRFLPDGYTAYKNKIGLAGDSGHLTNGNTVVLAWPYKDCILEGGQTKDDAARDEVFWNETLAPDQIDWLLSPKTITNVKRYDVNGEHSVDRIDRTDNLIIKGNNLLALHTIRNVYRGAVKFIYIDPPFNTENDSFRYNDNFSHSTWLTFIKNRLEVAKDLLAKDGAIAVEIDDNESAYMQVLMDEIFGRDNRVSAISIKRSAATGHKTINPGPVNVTEYLFLYAKDKPSWGGKPLKVPKNGYDHAYNTRLVNPDSPFKEWQFEPLTQHIARVEGFGSLNDARKQLTPVVFDSRLVEYALNNPQEVIRFAEPNYSGVSQDARNAIDKSRDNPSKIFRLLRDGYSTMYFQKGSRLLFLADKVRKIDGKPTILEPLTNFWDDISWQGISPEGGVDLKKSKKPEKLLHRLIEMNTQENDLVLDFFAGSGTTAAVAHKMGRRYICIEQMDYINSITVRRLANVVAGEKGGISKSVNWKGGGSFVYCELAQANHRFIDAILAATDVDMVRAIWQNMRDIAFLSYRVNPLAIDVEHTDFAALSIDKQKRLLIETLDKNLLYVPLSEMDDKTYGLSDADKALNRTLFGLGAA